MSQLANTVIVVQSAVLAIGRIISLCQYGLDCSHGHSIVLFMAEHSNGEKILEDLSTSKMDVLNPEA
jgi:hypothetical protein